MNQIARRYVISVTMKYKSQIPEMIIKICQDLNISQLLEQIIRAYREKVNEEIFSVTNIPLFQLFYQQQQLENADLMSECLGQDGTYELEINYLMNSRNAKVLERIKKIDTTISNFSTLDKKIEYDRSCKKLIIAKFSPKDDPNLPPVQFDFQCIGEEVTLNDLKQKILNKYSEQNPLYEYFSKPHIFALRIQDQLLKDDNGNQILHDLFPQNTVQVSLEIHFPVLQMFNNCKESCQALVQSGINFLQGLRYMDDKLKNYEESKRLEIIDTFMECSVAKIKIKVNVEKQDLIIKELKKVKDYYEASDIVSICSKVVCYGASNTRKLKALSRALKLDQIVSNTFFQNGLNYACSKYFAGATLAKALINTAFIIGGLFTKKMTKMEFVQKIGYVTGWCVAEQLCNGCFSAAGISAITALGFGSYFAFLGGIALGWAVSSFLEMGLNLIRNWLYPSPSPSNELSNSLKQLPELSQEQLYKGSLKIIGCDNLTTSKQIKKRKIEMMKELHPDHAKEKYDKARFLQVLAAFEIIKEYREQIATQSN